MTVFFETEAYYAANKKKSDNTFPGFISFDDASRYVFSDTV
jgi:hypothetical protein